MRFAQGWRQAQSFLRLGTCFRLTRPVIAGHRRGNLATEKGSSRVSQGEPWINRGGLHVDLLRRDRIFRRAIHRSFSPKPRQVKHVGLRVSSGSGIKTRLFFRSEFRFQSGRDLLGDITLDGEDIPQVAVVGLGPQMRVRAHFYQLGRNPHLAASTPHASFENISNPQLLSDLAQIPMRTSNVTRDARARDDLEISDFAERGQNVILHSFCEICVLLVVTQIREWQHGNAFFGNDNARRWNLGRYVRRILRSAAQEKERGNAQREHGRGHQ